MAMMDAAREAVAQGPLPGVAYCPSFLWWDRATLGWRKRLTRASRAGVHLAYQN